MLETAKTILRIKSNAFDVEIIGLIDACKLDLKLAGISAEKIEEADPLIKRAILTYVKAHFGYDEDEGSRNKFWLSYTQLKLSLCLAGDYNA